MFKKSVLTSITSFLVILSIVLGASIVHVELAVAASLSSLSDTLSSVKVNTTADHTIQFVTPSGLTAGQTLNIDTINELYNLTLSHLHNIIYMLKKYPQLLLVSLFMIVGLFGLQLTSKIEHALALALSGLSDTQSRLTVSLPSDHTIQFVTPVSGIGAGEAITITLPAGYATGTFAIANFDLATSTSASCASVADALLQSGAASGLTWGVTVATSTIYIRSGTATVPGNRCVQVRIGSNATFGGAGTTTLVNPSSPGAYQINLTSGANDTGYVTQYIVPDDAILMSGIVNQSLTFTVSTSTIYFGVLGAGAAKFASSTNSLGDTTETIAHTLAVGTNAPSGFTLSVRGQTMTSQQNSANTIDYIGGSAASSTPGVEQFGFRATESGGVGVTVSSPFSSPTSYGYNATATTSATVAVGSGSTPTSTFSVRYVTNINAVTEAGTYTASLIYVATANF